MHQIRMAVRARDDDRLFRRALSDLGAAALRIGIARRHDHATFREAPALRAGDHHGALNIG